MRSAYPKMWWNVQSMRKNIRKYARIFRMHAKQASLFYCELLRIPMDSNGFLWIPVDIPIAVGGPPPLKLLRVVPVDSYGFLWISLWLATVPPIGSPGSPARVSPYQLATPGARDPARPSCSQYI